MTHVLYTCRPHSMASLQELVCYEMLQSARQNYLADMAYIIASGKRLREDAKPFTQIIRQPGADIQDERTGQEIIESIRGKILERRKKGGTV